MPTPRALLFGLGAISVLETCRHWAAAPERVFSHFDRGGVPDAVASRGEFFAVQLLAILLVLFTTGILPSLLGRLPSAWINLPNKASWLGPEHRARTVSLLESQMAGFGCATLAVILLGFELAAGAEFRPDHHFAAEYFITAMLLYGLFVVFWLVRTMRAFLQVPADARGTGASPPSR